MLLWFSLWIPLIVLWCLWVAQAVLVDFQAGKFYRRVAAPPREGFTQYQPKAAVIVPFKGHDHELTRNVRALITQHYPIYRLVFVFENEHDPARVVIEEELAKHPDMPTLDLITAGLAPQDTGQKVHNQLAALAHLEAVGDDSEVWVFADSDAVPGPSWLGKLVGPHIDHERVGATTGYRWLMPELRAQRPRPASMCASVINSAVAMFIGHDDLTQAWGGSMAVRSEFARQHHLADYFRGAISDDYQVTRLCRDAGKEVYFVPHCLVPSPINFNWRELFEFGRRQYLITRVHDPVIYRKAVAVTGLYLAGFLTAWAAFLTTLFTGPTAIVFFAGVALVVVFVANQVRARYRRLVIAAAFGSDHLRYLRHTLRLDQWGTAAVMAVNLALLLSASVGQTLTWRNNRYRLLGPQSIQKL